MSLLMQAVLSFRTAKGCLSTRHVALSLFACIVAFEHFSGRWRQCIEGVNPTATISSRKALTEADGTFLQDVPVACDILRCESDSVVVGYDAIVVFNRFFRTFLFVKFECERNSSFLYVGVDYTASFFQCFGLVSFFHLQCGCPVHRCVNSGPLW